MDKLFAAMRDGTYGGFEFPDLRAEDVPALLELADSTAELTTFPVNPLSSSLPPKATSEGRSPCGWPRGCGWAASSPP